MPAEDNATSRIALTGRVERMIYSGIGKLDVKGLHGRPKNRWYNDIKWTLNKLGEPVNISHSGN
jgi:hypothetical protein